MKDNGKYWRGIKYITIGLLVVSLSIALGLAVALYLKFYPSYVEARQVAYSRMAMLEEDNFKKPEDTKIYTANNKLLKEINTGNYFYVTYDKTSHYLIDGYVAVEDKRFFEHNGLDYKALLRASKVLVKNKGEIKQGGSSITQQVIKNNVLFDVKERYVRKFAEFILAPTLESKYSKEKIMEFYLNTNFYGNNCYGVGSAAKFYFNKDVKDLKLHEAALLVGLSNSPSRLNPLKHEQDAIEKRNFVLQRMADELKITQEMADSTKQKDLGLNVYRELNTKDDYISSYAIHSAVLALMEKDGFEFKYIFHGKDEQDEYKENYNTVYLSLADQIRRGGYKIYSTIEPDIQKKAQEVLDGVLEKEQERSEDGRFALQASLAVVRNADQKVIALVGGRGTEDEFNRGYQGFRQPGSAIKPLLVYAPAFETGHYYPSKVMVDKEIKEKDAPQNYGKQYFGHVSLREAVGRSINSLPYKIIQDLGIENAMEYLAKLRFKGLSYQDNSNAVMALGGFTYGTTVEEMARAYSTFATKGNLYYHSGLNKLEDIKTSKSLLVGLDNSNESVYLEDTAYIMFDTLKAPVEEYYGTAQRNKIKKQVIVGKTGTTNEEKDVWFIGLNDLYTVAVWVGYDTPRPMLDSFNKNYQGKIFKGVMESLLDGKETKGLEKPETVYESFVDGDGDPTDNDTGRKGLFSKTIQRKMKERDQKELIEREQRRKEEQERLDSELSLEIDKDLNNLKQRVDSLEVMQRIEEYQSVKQDELAVRSKIFKLKDKSRKESFTFKLSKLSTKFGEREDVKMVLENEQRRRTEAEKERLSQLNLLTITQAQSKVMKLMDFKGDYHYLDMDAEKTMIQALNEANNLVYQLNDSRLPEVEILRKRFIEEKARIEAIVAEKEAEREEYNKELFKQKSLLEDQQRERELNNVTEQEDTVITSE